MTDCCGVFRMRYTADLGRVSLHHTVSQLQLRFSAAATLNNPTGHSVPMSPTLPQWPDPLSTWIKEAPKMEIRFGLRFSSTLEFISSSFISALEKRLCVSEVWSDIGFTVTHNTRGPHIEPDLSAEHFIALEFCRQINPPSFSKPSRVPAAPRNIPDIPCPQDLPAISLEAIEVFLDFDCLPISDEPRDLANISDSIEELMSVGFRPLLELSHTSTVDWDSRIPACFEDIYPDEYLLCEDDESPQLESLYDLIEFGLQRLITSTTPDIPFIQIVGADDLQLLRKLAPAIFNADYREGMNQRAASIPSIADAVSGMLTNTSNLELQHQLSYLPQDPRTWVTKSLWGKAQAQLPRARASKKKSHFFPSIHRPSINFSNQAIPPHDEEGFIDDDMLEIDKEENEIFEFPRPDRYYESDELLLRSSSESSFEDLHESTQTTQDSFQASLSTVSTPRSDAEMLLCDCDLALAGVESFSQLEI